jgi:hypothetical protein
MAQNPPPDLELTSLRGDSRTVAALVTVFHLVFVAVDPYRHTSAWIVPTAGRILTGYEQADCRVAWLVAATPEDARRFLGHWAEDILTFVDPDFTAVRAFGLESLPAIVHVAHDGAVVNAVEGWDPLQWRALASNMSRIVGWSVPVIPGPHDPGPFEGEPLPPEDELAELEAAVKAAAEREAEQEATDEGEGESSEEDEPVAAADGEPVS